MPVGDVGRHDSGRLSQRCREMGDAVVHRNDEIQIRYEPCGIGKIAKRLTELENAALIEYRLIDGSDIFFSG
jgi:hypothetical protein